MKKAGLFSKSGCNWWVTPGSNPSSKEKRANPIYENETHFLREKNPQTLGITRKEHCRTFLFGNDVFTLQKRSGIHWGARLSGFSKKSKKFHFSTYKRPLSNHRNFGRNKPLVSLGLNHFVRYFKTVQNTKSVQNYFI